MVWDYAVLKEKLRPPRAVRRILLVLAFVGATALLAIEVAHAILNVAGR